MTAKHTRRDGVNLIFGLWLTLSADGGARMTRTAPACGPDERAMKLSVVVPRSLFRVPTLQAEVKIPDPGAADILTADVATIAERAVRDALNMDVRVTIGESAPPEAGDTK